MSGPLARPLVAICVLTYGNYPRLAKQALDSIQRNCVRDEYKLLVGANSVSRETLRLLNERHQTGAIDRLIVSPTNLSKCPMMRRLFAEIDTQYIWWFDDDSYIKDPSALSQWLQAANSSPASTVLWGSIAHCNHLRAFTDIEDVAGFVRSAPWYRGLPPPSWRPGGKGEFNFDGLGLGDGCWIFILGGCWLARTAALRSMDWPDDRLLRAGEDVFFGEAIRQQGWHVQNVGPLGVAIDTEPTRGS